MTEDKYLEGIVVVLHDCEFCLSEYAATAIDVYGIKIILKNGVSFITQSSKNDIHNAIFEAGRLGSK